MGLDQESFQIKILLGSRPDLSTLLRTLFSPHMSSLTSSLQVTEVSSGQPLCHASPMQGSLRMI